MKTKKIEKKDPYNMYLGNLFIVENGIATVSDIKYVIIKEKSHFLAKPRYLAYPGEIEALVGAYNISIQDEGIPFLINSVRLSKMVGYHKITAQQVCDVIVKNNDPVKLKEYMRAFN